MKKVKLLVLLLPLLSSCQLQLDPDKTWIIVSKDRHLDEVSKMGICRFKLTDGDNYESFQDSCTSYRLGDTINHRHFDNGVQENFNYADSARKRLDTMELRGLYIK